MDESTVLLAQRAAAAARQVELEGAAGARRRLLRLWPRMEAALGAVRSERACFELTLGLDACFEQSGDREPHLALLDGAARRLDDRALRGQLAYRAARIEFLRGHWESALSRACQLARRDLPDDLVTDSRLIESAALRYLAPRRALPLANAALKAARSNAVRMRAHFHHAAALQVLGRVEQVEAASRAALALTIPLRAARHRALVLTHLSLHALAIGRADLACEYAAEGARRFEALGDRMMAAKAYTFLVRSQIDTQSPAAARTLARAFRMAARTGDRGVRTELALLEARQHRSGAGVRLRECLWDNEALGARALAERARAALQESDEPELALAPYRARLTGAGRQTDVDFTRHEKPRRILERLADARLSGEGPLAVDALLVAAWPGERPIGTSGQNRVYAAIRHLRRVGLGSVLRTSSAGYELTCRVRLVR